MFVLVSGLKRINLRRKKDEKVLCSHSAARVFCGVIASYRLGGQTHPPRQPRWPPAAPWGSEGMGSVVERVRRRGKSPTQSSVLGRSLDVLQRGVLLGVYQLFHDVPGRGEVDP